MIPVAAGSVALVAVFAAGLFAGYLELSGKGQLGAKAELDRAIENRLERWAALILVDKRAQCLWRKNEFRASRLNAS